MVEYLGENYPLYFTDMRSLEAILNDEDSFHIKLQAAHSYMKELDKVQLTLQYFGQALAGIVGDVVAHSFPASEQTQTSQASIHNRDSND